MTNKLEFTQTRWRVLAAAVTLIIAFAILFISILRTASITPTFTYEPISDVQLIESMETENREIGEMISYELVYPGSVLPDHPLWPLKVIRDRVWFTMTVGLNNKAELNLLFADKRLAAAEILFDKGKYEKAYTTLAKAEYYLQNAIELEEKSRFGGGDTSNLLLRISNGSLKHRYVIENVLIIAPEDGRPIINKLEDIPKGVYVRSAAALESLGVTPPFNPFDGE